MTHHYLLKFLLEEGASGPTCGQPKTQVVAQATSNSFEPTDCAGRAKILWYTSFVIQEDPWCNQVKWRRLGNRYLVGWACWVKGRHWLSEDCTLASDNLWHFQFGKVFGGCILALSVSGFHNLTYLLGSTVSASLCDIYYPGVSTAAMIREKFNYHRCSQ